MTFVQYHPCRSEADMCTLLDRVCGARDIEFVEALVYSPTHAVVMTGTIARCGCRMQRTRVESGYRP